MALKVQLRNKANSQAHSYASLLCLFLSDLDIIYTVHFKIKLSEIKNSIMNNVDRLLLARLISLSSRDIY